MFDIKNMKTIEEDLVKTVNQTDYFNKLLELYNLEPILFDSNILDKLPLAQLPTSENKPKTYVDLDKNLIIKGPYIIKNKKVNKIITTLKYTKALEILEKNRPNKTYWKWNNIWIEDNLYYLVTDLTDNLSSEDKKELKEKIKISDKNTSKTIVEGIQYWNRDDFGRKYKLVSKVDKKEYENFKNDIIQHLYLRYILGIGDSGHHNIIIVNNGTQNIAGIDLEDFSGKTSATNPYELLFKSASKEEKNYDDILKTLEYINWDTMGELEEIFTKEHIEEFKKRDNYFRKINNN